MKNIDLPIWTNFKTIFLRRFDWIVVHFFGTPIQMGEDILRVFFSRVARFEDGSRRQLKRQRKVLSPVNVSKYAPGISTTIVSPSRQAVNPSLIRTVSTFFAFMNSE